MATCLPACPLGIDVPGFIRLLREGDVNPALERIRKENPFPGICGRICPAPCEDACVFFAEGHPISIRNLERYAADMANVKPERPSGPPRGKKAAIIGSGPGGMSAAYFLARANFQVTIFEAGHEPGGLLRYAIPDFRLPQKVLDEQFSQLKAMGVEVQTNAVFGRTLMLDEIFMRGYSAVLLACGASMPVFSDLPGAGLGGVYYAMEFLNRLLATAKEGTAAEARRQMMPGPSTVVVGKGISAFDAARLSLRLGSQVKIIFDGFEEQAGVHRQTLQEAHEEGIETLSMETLEFVGDHDGLVAGVKCRKLDIVEDKGGLTLQPAAGGPVVLDAQTVVIANGSKPGDFLRQYLPQLKWNPDGSLWSDAQTGMTSIERVFGCGSLMTAGGSVAQAIAGGKSAAQKITQYLEGTH